MWAVFIGLGCIGRAGLPVWVYSTSVLTRTRSMEYLYSVTPRGNRIKAEIVKVAKSCQRPLSALIFKGWCILKCFGNGGRVGYFCEAGFVGCGLCFGFLLWGGSGKIYI